ncbi:MAG: RDD family protein [Tannerella sp.]|nr:RDD family protein [Tannerella sp.]
METRIITSQYVQIDQTPAGVGERIFARMLDYLIMFLYSLGIFYVIDSFSMKSLFRNDYGILWIFILYIPVIFYSFLWEILNRGRSPGKMAFGMRVVMRDGTTPTIGAYLIRWMLLLIDTWGWIGIIVILLNKNNQRLGDLAAGTIVIKERDYHRIQISLDEFNYLSRGYKPVYPQAENLSLEQVNTINEALVRYDSHRSRRIIALSGKVKEFLKITPLVDDETFLRTLTRDYQYYALEEI